MKNKLQTIFSETGCPADGVLQKYLNGELTHAQKHEIEKHLIDCEMCSDELEGLRLMNNPKKLNIVIERINTKINKKFKTEKRQFLNNWSKIAAAIVIFVAIGALFVLFNHKNNISTGKFVAENTKPKLSQNQSKEKTETSTLNKDTQKKLLSQNKIKHTKIQIDDIPSTGEKSISENKNQTKSDTPQEKNRVSEFDNKPSVSGLAFTETRNSASDEKLTGSTINDQTLEDSEQITENDKLVSLEENEEETSDGLDMTTQKKEKATTVPLQATAKESKQEENFLTEYRQENLYNQAIDDYRLKNYSSAAEKLEEILQYKDSAYFQKAQWYYALTLIKQDKLVKAKKILNQIIKTLNHPYSKEARIKLLEIED